MKKFDKFVRSRCGCQFDETNESGITFCEKCVTFVDYFKAKIIRNMKQKKLWGMAATLMLCGAMCFSMISCKECKCQEELQEVRSTEMFRTSQSWDGVELPDYPEGRPELVAVKYEIPAGQKLGWHHHPVMNYGILVQGDLTIIAEDGTEKTVHEGEAIVEMVGTVHHGENRGTKPVVLYMFYSSQKDQPLSVPHSELSLE